MKQLIFISCLASLIYLQSCRDRVQKNDSADSTSAYNVANSSSMVASPSNTPVSNGSNSVTFQSESDLLGYWVGIGLDDLGKDTDTTEVDFVPNQESIVYGGIINISIDDINDGKVQGHSVFGGYLRTFSGTLARTDTGFVFSLKEPGDKKADGVFKLSIATNSTHMKGSWVPNKAQKVLSRSFDLSKKFFHYDPSLKVEGQFVDYSKTKAVKQKSNGREYYDTRYFSSSKDVGEYNASADALTKEQVANLKQGDLIILRNSIFARHGYAFKKYELSRYFAGENWYIPISDNVQN